MDETGQVAWWGVYRVFKNGKTRYVQRSATDNEKLAREIAADLTAGRIVRPDGSLATVRAYPHEARIIRHRARVSA